MSGFDAIVSALSGAGSLSGVDVKVPDATRRLLSGRRSKKDRDEVDRVFTRTWSRWRGRFERRWYRKVTRRTGYSGVSFVLKKLPGRMNYRIENIADYAPYVHPSGRKTPLMAKEVRQWTDEYAREVAGQLRRLAQEDVRAELMSTLARVRAARAVLTSAA